MEHQWTDRGHYDVERYLGLGARGLLGDDDPTELLDGMVVSMPPPSPLHDAVLQRALLVVQRALGMEASVRVQSGFVVGEDSLLLPDLAVVPGNVDAWTERHPSRAHLVIEVAQSSLAQDRLAKSAIYARAGVPDYWILNVRTREVEVHRRPDRWRSGYREVTKASGADRLHLTAFPEALLMAGDFFPPT